MNKDLTVALYQEINKADQPREIEHWHASSIAKCPRALYFERKGIKSLNEPGAGKKLRWRSGHLIEASIRQELEKLYPNLLSNVRFTNEELDLTGEFDAYDPDSKTLISVKSVHDFAFITRGGEHGLKEKIGTQISPKTGKEIIEWGLKQEPYINHQWQEHAYLLLFEGDAAYEVERITYVYITLGGLIACYTTDVKPEITQRVKNKLDYLNKTWNSIGLPLCMCHPGQEMFEVTDQYCPYKSDGGCCMETYYESQTKRG